MGGGLEMGVLSGIIGRHRRSASFAESNSNHMTLSTGGDKKSQRDHFPHLSQSEHKHARSTYQVPRAQHRAEVSAKPPWSSLRSSRRRANDVSGRPRRPVPLSPGLVCRTAFLS